MYRACVLSTLLYGSETWCTKKHHIERLESFHTRQLRLLLGIKYSDRIRNTDVRTRAGIPETILIMIRERRLRWLAHVERMDDTRLPKQALHGQLAGGKRPAHKPRKRWVDCIREDLESFGISENDWAEHAQDREKWRILLKEGKLKAIKEVSEHEYDVANKRHNKRLAAARKSHQTNNGDYRCPHCDKTFGRQSGLTIHLNWHKRQEQEAAANVTWGCHICDKVCRSSAGLTNHLKQHKSSNIVLKCPQCNKVCKNRAGLTTHLKTHAKQNKTKIPSATQNKSIN